MIIHIPNEGSWYFEEDAEPLLLPLTRTEWVWLGVLIFGAATAAGYVIKWAWLGAKALILILAGGAL